MIDIKPELFERIPSNFKEDSLDMLKHSLSESHFPNYPTNRLTQEYPNIDLEDGEWTMNNHPFPTSKEVARLESYGYVLDCFGRPLHPWVNEMLSDSDVGVVTGKGWYWYWGPNYTGDPIIVRYDQEEPYIRLIVREDTEKLALPGGMVDPGEIPLQATTREAEEEALIDLNEFTVTKIYAGPLSDIRTTAHAWPHTFAYRFDITNDAAIHLPIEDTKGGPETLGSKWLAYSEVGKQLFGSHRMLVQLAIKDALANPILQR